MKKPARTSVRRPSLFPMIVNNEVKAISGVLRRFLAVFLFVAAVAFPFLVFYRATYPTEFLARSDGNASENRDPRSLTDSDSEDVSLERVLKEAAMEDGTVILTTLNEAWAAPNSIIDLFLESFQIGNDTIRLLNHLVIVTLDQKAYTRCSSLHTHCFALTTEGVDFSREKLFMTRDYLRMMWKRIDFLRIVLEMGYNFIFTDADIMWFRDPFPHFYLDVDFQIACDHFSGSSVDVNNMPNGGFNYVKSNNRTIEFYKFWYSSREMYPGRHDQDVFNFIKYDPTISEIGLKIRFLDTAYFGGFCEPSEDLNEVCTMHANCCLGLSSKLHDLRIMLEDWRKFMSLSPIAKTARISYWRVPQNCSLTRVIEYLAANNVTSDEKD